MNSNKKSLKISLAVLLVLVLATSAIFVYRYLDKNENKKEDIQQDQEEILDNSILPNKDKNSDGPEENSKEKKQEKQQSLDAIVPEGERVENSFFDDAVFIGNSRTQGLMLYGGISNAKFYADKGLMVNKISEKPINIPDMAEKTTVSNALNQNIFGKYYIMLGTNELGWAYENIFLEKYGEIIDSIKNINPSAQIYIQSVLPVSKEKSDNDKIYNNEKIDHINECLIDLAKEKNVFFVNVAEAFKDETGSLFAEKSSDGVHLKADACKEWADYLYTHTVDDGGLSEADLEINSEENSKITL